MLFRGSVTLDHPEGFRMQIPRAHRGAGSSSGILICTQLPGVGGVPSLSSSSPQGWRQGPSHTQDPTSTLSGCQTPSLGPPETHSPAQPTCCHVYVPSTFTTFPVPSEIHMDLSHQAQQMLPHNGLHTLILTVLTAHPWVPRPTPACPALLTFSPGQTPVLELI